MYDTLGQLRRFFDGSSQYMFGHQILTERRIRRKTPLWTKNDTKVRELILKSFPKMETDPIQRMRAGRWLRVIILYFRLGMTSGQISEEIGLKPKKKVIDIIQRIRRVAKGLSSDGKGRRLGDKRPGRPLGAKNK